MSMEYIQPFRVDNVFLDLENPRHESYTSQAEVIEYLCKEEYVYALAKDIARVGLNPLEAFAVIPISLGGKKGGSRYFFVAEGNRRLCAIKLLNDPELAPPKLRKDFKKLSESIDPITHIPAVTFKDRDAVAEWLDRIHGGLQGGVGRKAWTPDQKTRHTGDKKNVTALEVLDYAERQGFISAEERKGKLTTAQRYLGNAFLREALGIENVNIDDISRDRPKEDFDILLKKFMDDLRSGVVSSRKNSNDIKQYARELTSVKGLSGKRQAVESLSGKLSAKRTKAKRPQKPNGPKSLMYPAKSPMKKKFRKN